MMKQSYIRENKEKPFQPANALLPSYAALIIVSLIIGIKVYACFLSGATSMLASLIDSLGDAVISLLTYFSIQLSLKPADTEHRFGHGKAEGFSALFQSSFLMGSAFFLVFETGRRIFAPIEIEHHSIAIAVSCITVALTIILVSIQKQAYKKAPSLALKADRQHYSSDIFLNLAVISALLFDLWKQLPAIDLLISFGIAVFIGRTAINIAREAIDMLMDREIDETERNKIIEMVKQDKDVLGIHDLRTRKSGMYIYISFDVELEPTLSLAEAHDITRRLDLALLEIFPNAEIIIHKDPKGDTYDPRHKVHGVHH